MTQTQQEFTEKSNVSRFIRVIRFYHLYLNLATSLFYSVFLGFIRVF